MSDIECNSSAHNTSCSSATRVSDAVLLLWTVVPPVLLVLGTAGNTLTILVMRRTMDSSPLSACMSVYFSVLAVSDQLLLTLGLPRYLLIYHFQYDVRLLSDAACKGHMFAVYLLGHCSAWVLVAMTSQRVTSVLWPLRVGLQGTRRKALCNVALILCASSIVNSGIPILFSVVEENGRQECSIASTDSTFFYVSLSRWLDLALFSVFPSCALGINNVLLLWKVTRSVRTAKRMMAQGQQQNRVNSRAKTASSLSVTLVITSLAFFVLTLPGVISSLQENTLYSVPDESATVHIFLSVGRLLWYSNCSVNFYLYCLSGTKFRTEAKVLLRCRCRSAMTQNSS